MALDTKAERASIAGVGRPWYRSKQPGSNSRRWRASSGNTYAGVTILVPISGCIVATGMYQGGATKTDVYQGGSVAGQGGC